MAALPRGIAFAFLGVFPFIAAGLIARPLHDAGVPRLVGIVPFLAWVIAVWTLRPRQNTAKDDTARSIRLAGILLTAPFAIIALLWVGLGTPWEASAAENRMRYTVLLFASTALTCGFVLLKGPLADARDCFHAPIAAAAGMLAGASYVVWTSLQLGACVIAVRAGQAPESLVAVLDAADTLLFVACVLTYLATAALAASLARGHWLAPTSARVFITLNLILTACLAARGLAFPEPHGAGEPWYMRPGFIAGIPAVPWIMPHMLGVVALRRAAR